jgi:DNA polymerase-3 subunit delta'
MTIDPFATVVGQDDAIKQLRAALESPVHAYLLVGQRGSGKRALARAFAAALLAADAPSAELADRAARLALEEHHPDLHIIERVGASITVDTARDIVRDASLSPVEGERKVFILVDFHLVQQAGPTLLKAIEEPSATTTFIVLADRVPPELVTIASRCVRIDVVPLSDSEVVDALVASGVAAEQAEEIAGSARGDLERARLLARDPRFSLRRDLWWSVPARLDGTGATVTTLVGELRASIDDASTALEARQKEEVAELEARVERYGERGAGRRLLGERQRRELRRLRTDEVRFGLVTLASRYRDALADGSLDPRAALRALDAINDLHEALIRNLNEPLALQALLLVLPPVGSS